MILYFWIVRLAALFGHKKAKALVEGQRSAMDDIRQWLASNPSHQDIVWIHASSVGEFEQARPLIERLHREKHRPRILLTFFSPSGYKVRKNYELVDKVSYLPFATRKNARAFLDTVNPKMAIFVKYEWWPAYLKELHKREIRTYSIAAIFRRGQLFFLPWGKSYRNLLKCFTHIYVQDEDSRALLERFGITQCSVAGDTRFDRVNAIAAQNKSIPLVDTFVQPRERGGMKPKVIVAGSTWPEDELLLAQYMEEHPELLLILAPHEIHEEHLHGIFNLLEGRYVRYTRATRQNVDMCRVLVIDTIGMLSSLYKWADVTYIGGGFGVGIHNTIEAAVFGKPVIFGPNFYKFREAKGLIAAGAGVSIKDYATFREAMDRALVEHEAMGAKAREYVQSELGATEKIYGEVFLS